MLVTFDCPEALVQEFDASWDNTRAAGLREAMKHFILHRRTHFGSAQSTTSKATITELFAKHGNGQAAECTSFVVFTAILWMGACAAVGGAFIDCWGVLADGHQ